MTYNNIEKAVETESGHQIHNINLQINEDSKMEYFQNIESSVDRSKNVIPPSLNDMKALAGIDAHEDVIGYMFYKVSFPEKWRAKKFSKWIQKPDSEFSFNENFKEGNEYAVSFTENDLKNVDPECIPQYIKRFLPMAKELGYSDYDVRSAVAMNPNITPTTANSSKSPSVEETKALEAELIKQADKNILGQVSYMAVFPKRQKAVRFSKWVKKSGNGLRFHMIKYGEGIGHVVCFEQTGLTSLNPIAVQIKIDRFQSVAYKFGCTHVASQSSMMEIEQNQLTEKEIAETLEEAVEEKSLYDYIAHKSVFRDRQHSIRFAEWVVGQTDGLGFTKVIEGDGEYTIHYSYFKDNFPEKFIDGSLRAIRKASDFGGKYIGWGGFIIGHDVSDTSSSPLTSIH